MSTPAYTTVVIEYASEEEANKASFRPYQQLLGGRIIAIQFSDALEVINAIEKRIEELEEAQ